MNAFATNVETVLNKMGFTTRIFHQIYYMQKIESNREQSMLLFFPFHFGASEYNEY